MVFQYTYTSQAQEYAIPLAEKIIAFKYFKKNNPTQPNKKETGKF